jgi:hypothetical protein
MYMGLASMKKGYTYYACSASQNYVSGLPKHRNAVQWTDGRLAGQMDLYCGLVACLGSKLGVSEKG